MEQVTIRRFSIGERIESIDVEGHGNKWLFYLLLGEHASRAVMSDGSDYVEVADLDQWQHTYTQALVLTGVPASSVDLACERTKRLMLKAGTWKPLR